MAFVWEEGTGPSAWHLSLNGNSVALAMVPWMDGDDDDPSSFEVYSAITVEQFWEAVTIGDGLDDKVRNYLLKHKEQFREDQSSDILIAYSLASP